MFNITEKNLVSQLYFKKLPEIYRTEDYNLGDTPLLRYLRTVVSGGIFPAYKEANNILNLIDPLTCPEEFLPYLYETFGLSYYQRVDTKYHRIALKNISEILKRRGTYNGVRYIVQLFSGLDCHMVYKRMTDERRLTVYIDAPDSESIVKLENSASAIREYLVSYFIPHYINVIVKARSINKSAILQKTNNIRSYVRYTKVTTINNTEEML